MGRGGQGPGVAYIQADRINDVGVWVKIGLYARLYVGLDPTLQVVCLCPSPSC